MSPRSLTPSDRIDPAEKRRLGIVTPVIVMASEFKRDFWTILEIAESVALTVTRGDEPAVVMLPAAEYAALRRLMNVAITQEPLSSYLEKSLRQQDAARVTRMEQGG